MVTTERKKSSTKECKKVKNELECTNEREYEIFEKTKKFKKGFERKCIYNRRNKYREKEERKKDRKRKKKDGNIEKKERL